MRTFPHGLAALVWLGSATIALAADAPSKIDYNRQVRPILSDKCFACHGPDSAERKAGLRLDLREAAIAELESGERAIVPGKVDESAILDRIAHEDPSMRMPPAKLGKPLTDTEKLTLRSWIEQGAEYRSHWAFTAPVRPPIPGAKANATTNPIDAFLQEKMIERGLEPAAEASREALIRRLTLDLTGLPPTPAEIDAFLSDRSPNAYERLVDRLLESPHYGERMALDWLDAARFADTHGYHIDSGRDMTRWREWVINAFNRNVPFDRFTIEQIAGDLLPNPTLDQLVASGFNRNHMINFEGGAVAEEYLNAYIVDRVNTTSTVFLGLTVACTQCHDHKYDPLTQKEFYQFYAFFNNLPEKGLDGSRGNAEPMIKAPSAEQTERLASVDARIAGLRRQLDDRSTISDESLMEWERSLASNIVAWSPFVPKTARGKKRTKLAVADDGVIVADGANPATEVYVLEGQVDTAGLSGLRVEFLPDSRQAGNGPGRSVNGNVVLTDVRVSIDGEPVKPTRASADFAQEGFPIEKAIDADPASGWAIHPRVGEARIAAFAFEKPVAPKKSRKLSVELAFESQFASHQPGRFRVSLTRASDPLGRNSLPAEVAAAIAIDRDKRDASMRETIAKYYRANIDPAGKALSAELAALASEREAVERSIPTAMVMKELASPRDTFMLTRGQYDKKSDKVTADVWAVLPPLPEGAPRNRLTLARWLVDPKHPLTARVTVNRLWQSFFGTGIVRTTEDFGSQGEPPSHPELLDWLASEFVAPERGAAWDVKRFVKLLVMSEAYRRSSVVTPDGLAKDPENRLLARGARYRLPAEFIRDQALAVSGLLDPRIGGKSVSPYQPAGLWEELMSRSDGANWTAQVYQQSSGRDLYRRTMYTFWKRTCPPPTLLTFDAPDRETCTVRRARTNTPLQALILLNDPTYVEASRHLAERLVREGGKTDAERAAFGFRLVTGRVPTAEESAILIDVLSRERASFHKDPERAAKLLRVGESAHDTTLDPRELAAWSAFSGVLLNLDETVTKG
ncbi:MAG: PSD1 and planctomycete cytochrome C domain-containing protein [Isosphaeraceae bacterium]|nr:PSD1 and planctomycete cytochrome C domain-containing protein [Isosphaeraceae bacterium]